LNVSPWKLNLGGWPECCLHERQITKFEHRFHCTDFRCRWCLVHDPNFFFVFFFFNHFYCIGNVRVRKYRVVFLCERESVYVILWMFLVTKKISVSKCCLVVIISRTDMLLLLVELKYMHIFCMVLFQIIRVSSTPWKQWLKNPLIRDVPQKRNPSFRLRNSQKWSKLL